MGARHLSNGLAALECDTCGERSRPVRPTETDAGRVIRLEPWRHKDGATLCPQCAGTAPPPRPEPEAKPRDRAAELRAQGHVTRLKPEPPRPTGPNAPTPKQLRFLRGLATRTGTTFQTPRTKKQASKQIDRLLKRTSKTRPP